MVELIDTQAGGCETSLFCRIIEKSALTKKSVTRVCSVSALPEECARICAEFDLFALDKLAFDVRISPVGHDGWRLDGDLTAHGAQICSATLEPLAFELQTRVTRRWSPNAAQVDFGSEIDLSFLDFTCLGFTCLDHAGVGDDLLDEADHEEPLPEPIDIGAVALEALSLELPRFPRDSAAPSASRLAAPPGVEPMTDDVVKPFAGLAVLKKTMTDHEKNG